MVIQTTNALSALHDARHRGFFFDRLRRMAQTLLDMNWIGEDELNVFIGEGRHRAAIGLAGAIAPPLFSKFVLKAITNMAFSTEIFSEPICCI